MRPGAPWQPTRGAAAGIEAAHLHAKDGAASQLPSIAVKALVRRATLVFDGTHPDCAAKWSANASQAPKDGFDVSPTFEGSVSGWKAKNTMGYELVEPTRLEYAGRRGIYPTGGRSRPESAMWEAFRRNGSLGVDGQERPKMISVPAVDVRRNFRRRWQEGKQSSEVVAGVGAKDDLRQRAPCPKALRDLRDVLAS